MGTNKRAIMVLMLFLGLAVFAYGETLYGLSIGYYRLSEEFLGDDYGRGQNGINFNFTFNYFAPNKPLGFYGRTSFGTFFTGYEWKGDVDMRPIDNLASDLRISFAPSYKIELGSKVNVPVSVGPVFSFYWEEGHGRSDDDPYSYGSFYYEALKLGLMADAAIILSLFDSFRWFFLKQGFNLGWDFAHFERGERKTDYRLTRKTRYDFVPYSAFVFSVYFGIGVKLD